ncbi:MAG: CBS domain-containing protein [Byssovorax sp.]
MELEQIAKRVAFIYPEATVLEAAERMKAEKIGAMVVLDDGRLVGIISERDIVSRVVAKRLAPEHTRVSSIMTTHVITIHVGESKDEALERMHRAKCRHLPVVDRAERVVGMITILDLLDDRVEELSMKSSDLLAYIAADGPGG